MSSKTLHELKYPIGEFIAPKEYPIVVVSKWIQHIQKFPKRIRKVVENLNDEQLDTLYRKDGWSIRQVVHHCADSHMNCLTRFKLALTENKPTIRPYFEDQWAELPDSKMPIAPSLAMIDGIHERLTTLLKSLTEEQRNKLYVHPEHGREISLNEAIATYSWHSNHHLAHITTLIEEKNW